MEFIKNIVLKSQKYGKEFLADVFYLKNRKPKPVIIFSHGFKSFKDWGTFNLVAEQFALAGAVFVKFNFPFDGTTIENPLQITDENSFRINNYKIELDNICEIVEWVVGQEMVPVHEINKEEIYLLGHSRGGSLSILAARKEKRVKKVVTWSALADFDDIFVYYDMEQWKKEGVNYSPDRLENRYLPMDYSFYTEYLKYKDELNIPEAAKMLKIPVMLVHGTDDEMIRFEDALKLKNANKNFELNLLPNANHIYGGSHPFTGTQLPFDTRMAVEESVKFLLKGKKSDQR